MTTPLELPIKAFKTPQLWEQWLKLHHAKSTGVWIRFYKKASGGKSMYYAEALDVALCYGWIDSQAKTHDEKSYIQRFTPRGPRSIWSKINIGHVERLIKSRKMRVAGLRAIAAAKADGRWDRAYDSPKSMTVPADFLKVLKQNKAAAQFFKTLNKTNTYAIAWRLQTAKKPETRERRMRIILEMLARGEKFH
ncbi:MAG: YdeI/OmpD-associated family protein [Candidatus Buchananbacteria bacterium]|nr:YdeI/OmpD-associated family protein [Candidatus Buchananbacteria bacterium]